jgi:predicted  nucleic acid-binding Zn-ribbon protein
LAAKLAAAQKSQKELQAKAGNLDLDLKARDAHIDKLRTQQQTAKNNKEYQAFLIEINTAKVDKTKVEEEAMRVMEQVDKAGAESGTITTQLEVEHKRLTELAAQIDDTLKALQAEVDALMPARQQAAAALPPKVLAEFDRLADRFDGEALSALARPDRRREEYLCTSCNMDLVTDVYNKLHSRDELVFCPSCRRILFIPEDLPVQAAINTPSVRSESASKPKVTRTRTKKSTASAASASTETAPAAADEVIIEQRAKGKLGEALAKAQGESVSRAAAAGHNPFEFEVFVDGELAGIYKGISSENLERAVKYFMGESGLTGEIRVTPSVVVAPDEPAASEGAASTAATGDATAESTGQSQDSSPSANATDEPAPSANG